MYPPPPRPAIRRCSPVFGVLTEGVRESLHGWCVDQGLYHIDLYRLVDPGEVEPLGIRDLLTGGTQQVGPTVLLIEWPSRAAGALPDADLWIGIAYPAVGTEGREVRLTPHTSPGRATVRQIVAAIPELRQLSS